MATSQRRRAADVPVSGALNTSFSPRRIGCRHRKAHIAASFIGRTIAQGRASSLLPVNRERDEARPTLLLGRGDCALALFSTDTIPKLLTILISTGTNSTSSSWPANLRSLWSRRS
jgi:hypothetical protein